MSSNKRILKNSLFLFALTFSNYFLGLLLYPYLSRVLSVEGFGLFGFAMSFVLIFQVIIEFGFMISATALISKYRADVAKMSEIISTTMTAKMILTVASMLLFIAASFFVPMLRENFLVMSLFFINSVLVAMLPDFFFRGIEQMKKITIRTVLIRMLLLFLVFALVRDDTHIVFIPISFIIGNAVALFIAFVVMGKTAEIRLKRVCVREAIDSIKRSALFFMSRLAASINQSFGSFVLGLRFTPLSAELGLFTGASRLSSAGEMMLSPVSDSIYPHMVNKKDYKLLKKVMVYGEIVWIIGCAVVFVFAHPLCALILGEEFRGAGDYLRVLLFGNALALLSNLFGFPALSPIGKANHANIAIAVSATISVIACAVLWWLNAISVFSVCVVIASSNVVILTYRACAFYKYRALTKNADAP